MKAESGKLRCMMLGEERAALGGSIGYSLDT